MKEAAVVIGANFGDEGKGLITDFLAAEADSVVVRHNGGAQAGHTVTTPEGQRHVFSHFSGGSFAGAETFLSRFFICNPLLFMKELELLRAQAVLPAVWIDGRSPVTTPYDMMVNQIVEEARGERRHGSCGMGFGETVGRQEDGRFTLLYADLSAATLREKLRAIRDIWLPQRLAALGVTRPSDAWRARLAGDGVLDKFMEDAARFLELTKPAKDSHLAETRRKIIFEGAQGLLLDQARGWFPHVTRSHTGIKNALALAEEAGIVALDVTYVTRAYVTRHGAGPLPHELPAAPYAGIRDETNVPNPYQGTLRFGWLDAELLASSIQKDLSDNRPGLTIRHALAVTCLDQVGDRVSFVNDNRVQTASPDGFLGALEKATGAHAVRVSTGPARNTVMRV